MKLIDILEESAVLYKGFLELENKKYDAVMKNDIEVIDDIVAKEQVYYLKMKGIDQKREKLIESMGCKGMTLKEIINSLEVTDKNELNDKYYELSRLILEVKKTTDLCKSLIEVRMHGIDKALVQLGEKDNTYSNTENKNNSGKSLILSKKI